MERLSRAIKMVDLRNKNVICVGGFGGIGYATSVNILGYNIATLAVFDLAEDTEKIEALRGLNENTNVFFLKVDLADKTHIEEVYTEAYNRMDRIDIVVNAAGIMNEKQILRTVEVNLLGVIHSTLEALRYMDKSKGGQGGVIVNVSSLVALDSYPAYAVYTATKYGVNGFTRALADPFYYEQTQVSLITVCPSTTITPLLASLKTNQVTTFDRAPPIPKLLFNDQSADSCGSNIVQVIRTAKNGSVWILTKSESREYIYQAIS